jgi:hypothetical protein
MKIMLTSSRISTTLAGWRRRKIHIGIITAIALAGPYTPLSAMQTDPQDPESIGREIVTQLAARRF